MRLTKKQNGYTIVETLIVLAVTGVMFTATVTLISGQMSRYQFRESTLNAKQYVQDSINDTAAGYFALIGSPPPATCTGGSASVAGDSDCIYLGKIISIDSNGVLTSNPIIKNVNYPTVQYSSIFSETTSTVQEITSLNTSKQMPFGVNYSNPANAADPVRFAVAFTNFPTTDGSDAFIGGAQSTAVLLLGPSGSFGISNSGAILCMQNGNKQARLVIGRNGSTNVELEYGAC